MAAIPRQLALVSESSSVSSSDVARTSAALQKQATRDLTTVWDLSATVDAFERLDDVPIGYWPIIIRDDIGYDAAGIHLDNGNQPFALVSAGSDWSLTASHETLEMLVDPFGNRVVAGDSPKPDQGRVEFLVEVSDPSEAAQYGYTVNGILLSDFYSPRFFDPVQSAGVRYSFTGAIEEPRHVLPGGYLSWRDPVTDHWWQWQYFGQSRFVDLGKMDPAGGSLRSQIDRLTEPKAAKYRRVSKEATRAVHVMAAEHTGACESRAAAWHAKIDQILGRRPETGEKTAALAGVRRAPRPGRGPEQGEKLV